MRPALSIYPQAGLWPSLSLCLLCDECLLTNSNKEPSKILSYYLTPSKEWLLDGSLFSLLQSQRCLCPCFLQCGLCTQEVILLLGPVPSSAAPFPHGAPCVGLTSFPPVWLYKCFLLCHLPRFFSFLLPPASSFRYYPSQMTHSLAAWISQNLNFPKHDPVVKCWFHIGVVPRIAVLVFML